MQSIKHLRAILDWNQKDLASKAGISRSHLSEIESGKKSPSLSTLKKIGEALGLEAWELIYIESETDSPFTVAQKLIEMGTEIDNGDNDNA